MWDELENALAWYGSAPARWMESAKEDLSAAAEWLWEVIQGDFAEEQSTAQIATGTVISMIPFVDQLCDVRDVVANCRKINEDSSNKWAWVGLSLTLVGLFPVLGSLGKGCGKILLAYGRKSLFRASKSALDSDFWRASRPFVEAGIGKLNQHLAHPAVRKTLSALRIANPYKWLAGKIDEVASKVNASELGKAFDSVLETLRYFVDLIQRWGTEAMGARAVRLLQSVVEIRRALNAKVGEIARPVKQWLDKLARRLEVEGDMAYRAHVDSVNPHKYVRPTLAQDRVELDLNKPGWVDETRKIEFQPLDDAPAQALWPDISDTSVNPATKSTYQTFHDAEAVVVPPGEKLYRVVDPSSKDNSICWMREAEFKALRNRGDWRRRFAVWRHWNRNGEYVTYTVPPGDGLRVWEGATASQKLDSTSQYVLEGGGTQIVLDPGQLQPEQFGKRQPTGWGYTDFHGESDQFLGLPKLTNNMDERNLPIHETM